MATITPAKLRAESERARKLATFFDMIEEHPEFLDIINRLANEPNRNRPTDPPNERRADDRRAPEGYRTGLANVVTNIVRGVERPMNSRDLFPVIKRSGFALREENQTPKGLGKILAAIWKDGLLQRTEDGTRRYYAKGMAI